eukprot:TRINITY_DN29_c0_g2_i1.p1 TRINITY_DN29_c0_g2~~TRINITY_DN29_c0_g2_i1.p1  ORF type:complete len:452 (-),score=118.31 TRINITY_DN29_c0_g2_i1:56-1363(-)
MTETTTTPLPPPPSIKRGTCNPNKIMKYTFLKKYETHDGVPENSSPFGLALDRNTENIIFTEINHHRVKILSNTGQLIKQFGEEGSEDGKFSYPRGVVVDADSNIYVCDTNNHRIQIFDKDGQFLWKFGKKGNEDGELDSPAFLAVDSEIIAVTDSNNNRIQIYDKKGTFIRNFAQKQPEDFIMKEEFEPQTEEEVKANKKKRIKKHIPREGIVDHPNGIKFDNEGNIVVVDSGHHRLQIFDRSGKFLRQISSKGSTYSLLYFPVDVDIDSQGFFIVADSNNHRIQMFHPNGDFFQKWGQEIYVEYVEILPTEEEKEAKEKAKLKREEEKKAKAAKAKETKEVKEGGTEGAEPAPGSAAPAPAPAPAAAAAPPDEDDDDDDPPKDYECKKHLKDGEFMGPMSVLLTLDGKIFVSDCGNNRIQVFEQKQEEEYRMF